MMARGKSGSLWIAERYREQLNWPGDWTSRERGVRRRGSVSSKFSTPRSNWPTQKASPLCRWAAWKFQVVTNVSLFVIGRARFSADLASRSAQSADDDVAYGALIARVINR